MKNNFKKTILIISITLAIFCCLIFVFLLRQINLNKKISEENETKWQQEADRRDGIKSLNSSIKKIENERDLLDKHFAQSLNIVPFLDTVESIGEKVGVQAEVILVDIPKESKSLVLDMRASGKFEDVYKFILLLENSPYELEFISVDFQKDSMDKNQKWIAVLKMKLLSFVQ